MAGDSILVIGGDGVIGAALIAYFKQENKSVFSTTGGGFGRGRTLIS
jgi:nucleoside-diphosphate-sugar epimerase